MHVLPETISVDEYLLVYNALSFVVASMGASTFFFFHSAWVAPQFKTALVNLSYMPAFLCRLANSLGRRRVFLSPFLCPAARFNGHNHSCIPDAGYPATPAPPIAAPPAPGIVTQPTRADSA